MELKAGMMVLQFYGPLAMQQERQVRLIEREWFMGNYEWHGRYLDPVTGLECSTAFRDGEWPIDPVTRQEMDRPDLSTNVERNKEIDRTGYYLSARDELVNLLLHIYRALR